MGEPDIDAIKQLERNLPAAPDGTKLSYYNPFCCPKCSEPYIDFSKYPEQRPNEYYGNTYYNEKPIHYESQ